MPTAALRVEPVMLAESAAPPRVGGGGRRAGGAALARRDDRVGANRGWANHLIAYH